MNKLKHLSNKLLTLGSNDSEKTVDQRFEEQRSNLHRLSKLCTDLLAELDKQKDARIIIGDPLQILAEHVHQFYEKGESLEICGTEFEKTAHMVNYALSEYSDNYRTFVHNVTNCSGKVESLKQKIASRDQALAEFDATRDQLTFLIEKYYEKAPKSDTKLHQAETKFQVTKNTYELVNAALIEEIRAFYDKKFHSFLEEFQSLLESQKTLFLTMGEAYTQLQRNTSEHWIAPTGSLALSEESKNTDPIVNWKVEKKRLTAYMVKESWFKGIPPLVCSLCEQQVNLEHASNHEHMCEKIHKMKNRSTPYQSISHLRADKQPEEQEAAKCFTANQYMCLWEEFHVELSRYFDRREKNSGAIKFIRRDGIPDPLRAKIWPVIAGVVHDDTTPTYAHLSETFKDRPSEYSEQIEKDLLRTFPQLEKMAKKQDQLRNVLRMYSFANPSIGYCQSMNFLAALLLLYLDEDRAFDVLTVIIEDRLPQGYYTTEMTGLLVDQRVFKYLFALKLPKLKSHLEKLQFDLEPLIVQWFLCLFVSVLRLEESVRCMELFLYEGDKMLFRLALAVLDLNKNALLQIEDFSEMFIYLQNMMKATDFNQLVKRSFEIKVPRVRIATLREKFLPIILRQQEEIRLQEEQFKLSDKVEATLRILSKAEQRRTELFKMAREAQLKEELFLMDKGEEEARVQLEAKIMQKEGIEIPKEEESTEEHTEEQTETVLLQMYDDYDGSQADEQT